MLTPLEFHDEEGRILLVGSFSVLFRIVAISNKAFLIMSPYFNDKVVVDGGSVSIVTMYVAACPKNATINI